MSDVLAAERPRDHDRPAVPLSPFGPSSPDMLETEADQAAAAVVRPGPAPAAAPPPRSPPGRGRTPAAGVQRQEEPSAATDAEAVDLGTALIVDDDQQALEGQLRRTEFLERGVERVKQAADEELAAVGRDTDTCPYIQRWLERFSSYSTPRLERAVVRFSRPTLVTIDGYLEAIDRRVREAVHTWISTGSVVLPPGVSGTDPGSETAALQGKAEAGGATVSAPAAAVAGLGPGRPIPSGPRTSMERAFGHDFAGVRVHTDGAGARAAKAQRAQAFTVGDHLVFGQDRFDTGSLRGQALLAHELAHVVQQRGGGSVGAGSLAEDDADAAAADALLGNVARPRRTSALSLQRCDEPEPMSDEDAKDFVAEHHLRVVLIQDTTKVLSGMRKSVAVAANAEDVSDLSKRTDDTIINFDDGDLHLYSVHMDYTPAASGGIGAHSRWLALHARTGNFTAHFMGEGSYKLTAAGRIGPILFKIERTFTAEKADFSAASLAAVPKDLGSQHRTLEQERLFWLLQRSEIRSKAAEGGHIAADMHATWLDLSLAIIRRAVEMEDATPTTREVVPLQTAVDSFETKFTAEPKGWNGRLTRVFLAQVRAAGAGSDVAALRNAAESLVGSFDRWLLQALEEDLGDTNQLVRTLEHALGTEEKLKGIASIAGGRPVKQVPAVFHAKSAYLHRELLPTEPMSTGRIVPLPLSLWLVKTGDTSWELHDITFPSKRFKYDVTAANEKDALRDLLHELRNDEEHFPDGMLYVEPQGYMRMDLKVESDMDFIDWLQLAAVVFAVIGFSLVTLGTGTVAAVGGAMLVLGAAAGAGVAVVDTINAAENGRLTKTRLALNTLQFVASVASAGSATILTRGLAVGGRAAVAGLGQNARYVFLTRAGVAADVATLAVMGVDTAAQLGELSKSGSENKSMYAGLLLGQLFIQGSLTIVSVRSEVGAGDLKANPAIRIEDDTAGLPVIKPQTPVPTVPTWTIPSGAKIAAEVTDQARFTTVLGAMDPALRDQVLASQRLQRALVNGGYDPADLVQAWGVWNNRATRPPSKKITAASFEDYIATHKGFTTAGGAKANPDLLTQFPQWGSWSSPQKVRALAAMSHGELLAALDPASSTALPAGLRQRITDVLDNEADSMLGGHTKLGGAREGFAKAFNQRLGQLVNDVPEFTAVLQKVPASNQGSIGEWFAHFHLIDDATRALPSSARHMQFTSTEVPALSGQNFNPDRIDTAAHQTLDLKTGYHGGQIEWEQVLDYDALRRASSSNADVGKRTGGPIERHNWLFQPAIDTNVTYLGASMQSSQAAAARTWRQLQSLPGDALSHQRVFYLARDGQIHEVLEVFDNGTLRTRPIGTSIADIFKS